MLEGSHLQITFLPILRSFAPIAQTEYVFSVTRRSRSDVVHLLTHSLMVSNDLTDVTLVSDDTERGLDWCDSGE